VTGRPHYPPGRLRKGPRRPEAINNGGNRPLYIYNPILFGPKATYGQPGRGYEGTLFIPERRGMPGLGLCAGIFFCSYWLGRSTYFAGWQGWRCAGSFFYPCWLWRSTYFSEQNRWEYINRSQIHDCGNWERGRAVYSVVWGRVQAVQGKLTLTTERMLGWRRLWLSIWRVVGTHT